MIRRLVPVALLLLTAACSNPEEQVRTVDSRPGLTVANAPAFSDLLVDGIAVGKANEFVTRASLVEPGRHVISIRAENGAIVHQETIFVSGAVIRRISLPVPVQ